MVKLGIGDQWDADLTDKILKAKRWIYQCLGIFCKCLWMCSLYNKNGESVTKEVENILREDIRSTRIRTSLRNQYMVENVLVQRTIMSIASFQCTLVIPRYSMFRTPR